MHYIWDLLSVCGLKMVRRCFTRGPLAGGHMVWLLGCANPTSASLPPYENLVVSGWWFQFACVSFLIYDYLLWLWCRDLFQGQTANTFHVGKTAVRLPMSLLPPGPFSVWETTSSSRRVVWSLSKHGVFFAFHAWHRDRVGQCAWMLSIGRMSGRCVNFRGVTSWLRLVRMVSNSRNHGYGSQYIIQSGP